MTAVFQKIYSFFMSIIMFFSALFGGGGKVTPQNPDVTEPSSITDVDDNENEITVKNVILMIGDGMGFNSINKAVSELGLTEYNLQRMPYCGESRTKSANSSVTDSAAGGTALACGVKTNNNCVGVYPSDINAENTYPQNLCEMSLSVGKSTGIVTTDTNSGATPAAFSAHTSNRNNADDITVQQLSSGINLIWSYKSSATLAYDITGAGYSLIQTKEEMLSSTSSVPSFGQFAHNIWHNYDYNNMPSLAQITTKAIDILDDDEDGFFLMVEGAHIDKNSHNNDGEKMIDAFGAFDKAIGAALDYAETHSGTVVIVTADHETGGIKLNNDTGIYEYTTGNHTGVNVPVFVYGCDDFMTQDEIMENTEIPVRIARYFEISDFPKTCTVTK